LSDADAAVDDPGTGADDPLDAVDEVQPVVTTAAAAPDQFAEDAEDDDDVDGNRAPGGTSRAVLEYLAKSIVDDAESVFIDVEQGRGGLTLRLHVSPSDMGRVIGRRGRVAQAIRTVVRAAGASEGVNAEVDIVD
jgi:uncharacterized protein